MLLAAFFKASTRRLFSGRRLLGVVLTALIALQSGSSAVSFAAPSPAGVYPKALPSPNTQKQAVDVITIAENRSLDSYFIHGGSAEDVKRLDADMATLAKANAKIGMADDPMAFGGWYATNKTSLILARGELPFKNLQGYFSASFLTYKKDTTTSSAFNTWLANTTANLQFAQISPTAYLIIGGGGAIVFGIVKGFISTVKGALIAGPEAGVVGAYVDPVARVLRENAGVAGSRHLGNYGIKLQNWFAARQRAAAAKELAKLGDAAAQAESDFGRAREMLERMGYQMSPEEFTSNVYHMEQIWGAVNKVWNSINTGVFKDGRSLTTDASINRPMQFASLLTSSVTASELFHQGIEDNIDRIITRTGRPATEVEPMIDALIAAIDEREKSDVKDIVGAELKISEAREKLKSIGAPDRQVQRLIEQRRNELVFIKQTIGTLAANMIHDFQYEEFNRTLPDVAISLQRIVRASFCIEFYHHEMSLEVVRLLREIGWKIKASKEVISDIQEIANMKTTNFSDSKQIEETNEKRRAARSKLQSIREHGQNLVGTIRRGIRGETCTDFFSPHP